MIKQFKILNKSILLLLIIVNLPFVLYSQKDIKPISFDKVVKLKGKKYATYYQLTDSSKIALAIDGPGVLTVYNRVSIDKNSTSSNPYTLEYNLNGRLRYTRPMKAQLKSKQIRYAYLSNSLPSTLKKFDIKIPPGSHVVHFNTKGIANQIGLARFLYQPNRKLIWKEISSLKKLPELFIAHPELNVQRRYARINSENGFVFNAEGHSKIRIYFRAEFDYTTHEQDIIRLKLLKNGNCEAIYKATCFRSDKAEYLNDDERVPGTLRKYYIDIDTNDNAVYEIALKDPSKTAIIRVSLGKEELPATFSKL